MKSQTGDSQTSDRPRCGCHGEAMLRNGVRAGWVCAIKKRARIAAYQATGIRRDYYRVAKRRQRSREDQARITELLAQLPDSVKEVLRG